MRNEEDLLEQKELRDQMINKVEVLEKVKSLLLIPNVEAANINQVSLYYEVTEDVIKKVISRHEDELILDGMLRLTGKETKEFLVRDNMSPTNFRGYFEVDGIKFANKSNLMIPRRAILRIGMLLRDSTTAKEIRTQLLNIEEKTSIETKVQDINEEQKIQLEIGMAYGSSNPDTIMLATAKYMEFKNRHIKKQEEHITKLQQDNKALTGEILTWKDRAKMNHAIRKLAGLLHKQIGVVWNDLYQNLYYQYRISVKARGDSPYIQHIKESEWGKVIKTFSAMCKNNNISPSDIFNSIGVSEENTNA